MVNEHWKRSYHSKHNFVMSRQLQLQQTFTNSIQCTRRTFCLYLSVENFIIRSLLNILPDMTPFNCQMRTLGKLWNQRRVENVNSIRSTASSDNLGSLKLFDFHSVSEFTISHNFAVVTVLIFIPDISASSSRVQDLS